MTHTFRSFRNLLLPLACVLIFFIPLFAQNGGNFDTPMFDYQWNFEQGWDKNSNTWGDTTYLEHLLFNTSGKPVEAYIWNKGESSDEKNKMKTTMTWEGELFKSGSIYFFDTESSMYSATQDLSFEIYYENNTPIQYDYTVFGSNTLINLFAKPDNVEDILLEALSPYFSSFQMKSSSFAEYQNGKIVKDSTVTKISIASTIPKLYLDPLLASGTIDTNLTNESKTVYTYGSGYELRTYYSWNSENSEWKMSNRDSLNNISDKKYISAFYSKYDNSTETFIIDSKDTLIYNTDGKLNQIVTYYWDGSMWVHRNLDVYMHTAYQGAGIKFNRHVRGVSDLKAIAITTNHNQAINLSLEKKSPIAISVFDMNGKRITNSSSTLLSGMHTIPLNVTAQGNYICKISDGMSTVTVPFKAIR